MLIINVPKATLWDEEKEEFIYTKEQELRLEHSLVAISKWESKFHKPFFSKTDKTVNEIVEYIKCMTLTQNVDPYVYLALTEKNYEDIRNYIDDSMTATTFSEISKGRSNDIITAEIVYYWMISYNIPIEFQKWHINRLLTLIRVCDIKNNPSKKMSMADRYKRNSALNSIRRKRLNSKG